MSVDHALEVHRDYPVGPDQVFDGFLGAYDDPRPDWVLRSELDLRIGGAWLLEFRPPGLASFTEHRVFTVVDRPRRLAYRARIAGPNRTAYATDVEVTIVRSDGGTRLTLAQAGFPNADVRDEFANAWPDVLEMIATRIEPSS